MKHIKSMNEYRNMKENVVDVGGFLSIAWLILMISLFSPTIATLLVFPYLLWMFKNWRTSRVIAKFEKYYNIKTETI